MVKLKEVCTIIAGQSPASKFYNKIGDGIPFFQGKADFGDLYPTITTYCTSPIRFAEKNDILLSVRAPVGATNLAPCKVCIGRGLTAIRPESSTLNTTFLLYFFRYFEGLLKSKGTGTTFDSITQDIIKNIEINIPTLVEQQRIVERIEELFSELDKAEKTLLKIKSQLEVYKQAVLKEAFEGLPDMKPLKELTSLITSGSRGWAKYYCSSSEERFVRITDLTRDNIILKNDSIQYLSLPDKVEGVRSKLEPDDILISITADLGSIALIPKNIGNAYINQHIAVVRLLNKKQSELIAWYLKSENGHNDLLKNQRGNGKVGLGLDDVRNTPVPMVEDNIAHEIVEDLKMKMTNCEAINSTVTVGLEKLKVLRQSILKEAFEGKLV